ncbi:hypothetical protein GIB67_003339 [Kingdonia uniflora]|uniref:DUF1985 domain-containing protein n=1 Tax=Kingdonia uniflora TaxID=39325 RepID=A0A7J7P8Q9_9MAGN|nr:hypothetical protein GIB67_003339 [Kingdonia uniflora]
MFVALPEEEKSVLRATYFAPLLLINPIATMSTLVVEIFDRHLGDMKFQFGETIIQMKSIHVYLILGLRVSPIANEFLFVDPKHMMNFRMRRFPKKKNTYGLKEIDDALKQAKLERYHEDVFRLNLLKIILSFFLPNKGRNVWVKYVDLVDDLDQFNNFPWAMKPSESNMQQGLVQEAMYFLSFLSCHLSSSSVCIFWRNQIEAPTIEAAPIICAPTVGVPAIGSSSSATKIKAVVVRQVAPGEGLEVVKDLIADGDVKVNLEAISSEYGGGLLKWKKGDKNDNYDNIIVEENVKFEEEQPQVVEEEDSEPPTVVTLVVAEVVKADIVFFNQEDVVGEAYQASADQANVISVEEQTIEVYKRM